MDQRRFQAPQGGYVRTAPAINPHRHPDEGIDVFSSVGIDALPDADRASVLQFFPAARSVIVFGKEVPVYGMP